MRNASTCCFLAVFTLIASISLGQQLTPAATEKKPIAPTSDQDSTVVREANAALDAACASNGPGATVLIAKGDQILYRDARGMANVELGVPLSADNIFRIASVTKTFTAAMILKLGEAGKLKLDDPLAMYLPDFPNAANISLRELLNHTSGVSDIVKNPIPGFTRRDVKTAELIAEIAKRSPDFAPGTQFRYSNAGFIVLGAVIEKVTGMPWYAAIQQQLLQPLGIANTQFGASQQLIPGRAAGYSTDDRTHTVSNAAYISSTYPAAAGGLVSTVDDLRLWMRALTNGHAITAASFQQMITPPDLPGVRPNERYGLGIYLWLVRGVTFIGHSGDIDGFTSTAAYLPGSDVTVVVLANDDSFDAQTMARRLAAIALGQPYVLPVAVPISTPELAALAGKYQLDPTTVETLSVKDGMLYAQRGSRNLLPLQMTADKQLHFVPDELSYFVPIRDAQSRIVRLDYFFKGDGPPIPLPRIPE